MPTIRMPDGANVSFPDDMPADQIRGMIQKKFPNTDFTRADPGFWSGVGRMARGFASGVGSFIEQADPYLPTGPYIKPEEKALVRHPPKDPAESAGVIAGQVAPSFAIPELGASRAVGGALRAGQATYLPSSMAAARAIPFAETMAEGGAQGALGGAMIPSDDRGGNAVTGALAGGGVRTAGKMGRIAIDAIPPHTKNTLSALAAALAANKMGVPWWAVAFGPGNQIYHQLYNANLADLASQWFERTSRTPPAVIGATAGEIREKNQ